MNPKPESAEPHAHAPLTGTRSDLNVPTPEEIERLIEAQSRRSPTGMRNRAATHLLADTGLRTSELLAIFPHHVEEKEGRVGVHTANLKRSPSDKALQDAERRFPKLAPRDRLYVERLSELLRHSSPVHTLSVLNLVWRPLSGAGGSAMLAWMDARAGIVGKRTNRLPVFVTCRAARSTAVTATEPGSPWNRVGLRSMLAQAAKRASVIPAPSPRGFRHALAIKVWRATKDLEDVRHALGHESITVTAEYLRGLRALERDRRSKWLERAKEPDPEATRESNLVERIEASLTQLAVRFQAQAEGLETRLDRVMRRLDALEGAGSKNG